MHAILNVETLPKNGLLYPLADIEPEAEGSYTMDIAKNTTLFGEI